MNTAEQPPPAYNKREQLLYLTLQADNNFLKAQQQKRDLVDEKITLVNAKNDYEGPFSLSTNELIRPFCRVMYQVAKNGGLHLSNQDNFFTDQKPRELLAVMQAHPSGQATSILNCFLDNGTDKAHCILDELLKDDGEIDEGLSNFLNGASNNCHARFADYAAITAINQ